ncbi:MAG: hypothetical protein OXI88_10600 [Gammaproteobacteria bacterium]|nr:hypothetical protein [Gammaproteobacteria bacterium]MDE0285716.1 hypothetical protein [Gammaproteobacteria bacterium]MDE0512220.1 hypothetical protein [Gammaproteobacteria bacterium]
MAVLMSYDLAFDFRYAFFDDDWVIYQIGFLWKNEPILREQVLKYQDWREIPEDYEIPQGAFLANDVREDWFLPILGHVLDTDKAECWQPLEPDITVAIYSDNFFPFAPEIIERKGQQLQYLNEMKEAKKKLKEEKGKQPDDRFQLFVFADTKILKDSVSYTGSGIGLKMNVKRQQLEIFYNELEAEYTEFKKAFKID